LLKSDQWIQHARFRILAAMNRRELLHTSLGIAALFPARRLLADTSAAALPDIAAKTLMNTTTTLRGRDLHDLALSLRGQLSLPHQPGYDDARRVWNGMFDKHPAVIARCASASDAMRVVDFARSHQLLTAVRAGGHSLSGKSTCDGGLVVDVSPMQGVRVDPKRRIAHVDGGSLLRHLDRESSAFGLVTTAGTVSHTGAAGLTLGGGLGRVGRRFGLACDNLRSLDVVTADGRLRTANQDENPELFWGLRGAGGNFGVVTSFEYDLHPMSPTILGGAIGWPIAQARDVLRFYADFSTSAPDELNLDVALVSTPDGLQILFEACWSADIARGERVLAPVRSFGKPAFDKIAPMKYLELQSGSDRRLAHGIRFYGKSGFVTNLNVRDIDQLIDVFTNAPPGSFSIVIQQGGGAIGRKPVSATAFPNRHANYWVMLSKSWTDPTEDAERLEKLRSAWKAIEPMTNGLYVNAITDDESARVASNYGSNYPRLRQLKRKYDPSNLFRLNANIVPA
jgi:FAD/FMN-containing dehydrogenase